MTLLPDTPEIRSDPLVSVVVPFFDRAHCVAGLLQTLEVQNDAHWELIVVDDCSSEDPTPHFINGPLAKRIRVVRLPRNCGPAIARNAGIDAARGRFIAFLDTDDSWTPGKLSRQVEAMLAAPNPDMTFCWCQSLVEREGRLVTMPARGICHDEDASEYLFINGGFAQTSTFMLGSRLARGLRFRAELRQYEDNLYFIGVRAAGGSYLFIAEPMSTWSFEPSPDRLSSGAEKSLAAKARFIKAAAALLTTRARIKFELTHLGGETVRQEPLRGLALLLRGVATRLITPRYAAWVLKQGWFR